MNEISSTPEPSTKPQHESWLKQPEDEIPILNFSYDFSRPPIKSFFFSSVTVHFDPDLNHALRQNPDHTTAVLYSALAVLLWRYTGQAFFFVGAILPANSNSDNGDGKNELDFFTPIHFEISGDEKVSSFVQTTSSRIHEAVEDWSVSGAASIELSEGNRGGFHAYTFQVIFQVGGTAAEEFESGELRAQCELAFDVIERDDNLGIVCTYDTELFDGTSIRRVLDQYVLLLKDILRSPEKKLQRLCLLEKDEKNLVIGDWNRSEAAYPEKCVHELFESWAETRPESVALICGGEQISYAALNSRANQLAHQLRTKGVKIGDPVGVYMNRSIDLITSILAILKAGGAYVPLDPSYPMKRTLFMVRDARIKLVVTDTDCGIHLSNCIESIIPEWHVERGESPINTTNLGNDSTPDSLAYIMYTSGSTGDPKGVAIPHRGIVRLLWGTDFVPFGPGLRLLSLAPVTFDASTFEIWGALLHGALCVVSPERLPGWRDLETLIREYQVNCLFLTSSWFNTILDEHPQVLAEVSYIVVGGEALSVQHIRHALEILTGTRLINGYGPTECTTFACTYPIPHTLPDNLPSIPIGRPIANTRAYVLDSAMQPLPVGVPGELYLGGDGVALGYWDKPDLTLQRFIPDPFSTKPGARLFKTGDRVRWLPEGDLEFLGRLDRQWKIRGYRIEPGEIEETLRTIRGVNQAVVIPLDEKSGSKSLVAFVCTKDKTLEPDVLQRTIQERLPSFMVPSRVFCLDELPLLPGGKVDMAALKSFPVRRKSEYKRASQNEIEHVLAEIWSEVYGTEEIGFDDHFVDLGGDSLKLMRVINRIRSRLGREISFRSLFDYPTIHSLSSFLMRRSDETR